MPSPPTIKAPSPRLCGSVPCSYAERCPKAAETQVTVPHRCVTGAPEAASWLDTRPRTGLSQNRQLSLQDNGKSSRRTQRSHERGGLGWADARVVGASDLLPEALGAEGTPTPRPS